MSMGKPVLLHKSFFFHSVLPGKENCKSITKIVYAHET